MITGDDGAPRSTNENDGAPGAGSHRNGANGSDLVLMVPDGTVVRDAATGELLADMVDRGEVKLVDPVHQGQRRVAEADEHRGGRGDALTDLGAG